VFSFKQYNNTFSNLDLLENLITSVYMNNFLCKETSERRNIDFSRGSPRVHFASGSRRARKCRRGDDESEGQG